MKNIAILSVAAVLLGGCAKEPAKAPADQLRDRLEAGVADGKVLFGHHDDPVYGHNWKWEEGRSDVLETVGEYPALMSWDLGGIEKDSVANLDGVPFDRMKAEVKAQDARGGVNTFSWHLCDPVSGVDSWTVNDSLTVSRLVNTPEGLEAYNAALDKLAAFFLSLTRDDGNRIGVIFRPWHEHTGSWFWWGHDNCSVGDYRKLWTVMRENFDRNGVDNVLWAYSPDRSADTSVYLERYPGDEYVDIMGADVYYLGGEDGDEVYRQAATTTLGIACEQAKARGKLAAFTETGCESMAVTDWFTAALLPVITEYPVAYVTVWRNAYDRENHFFAPYPGHPAQDDFKIFHDNPTTIFVK